MDDKGSVFIADSCIGGLSVLKSMWHTRAVGHAIFLADYAINPLGVKSDESIARVVTNWLSRAAGVSDTLVIACNTLSIRYEQLRELSRSDTPTVKVLSMVDSLEAMLAHTADQLAHRKLLVVGTEFTARQPLYTQIIERTIPGAVVDTIAATELERKIARFEGWQGAEDSALTADLRIAIGSSDVAILACTCFPMVKTDLEAMFPGVVFLDPGSYCAGLLTGEGKARHKKLSIDVTGDEVPATSVISFAKSFLSEESIDLYRRQ